LSRLIPALKPNECGMIFDAIRFADLVEQRDDQDYVFGSA
jgi:hypothetical protein